MVGGEVDDLKHRPDGVDVEGEVEGRVRRLLEDVPSLNRLQLEDVPEAEDGDSAEGNISALLDLTEPEVELVEQVRLYCGELVDDHNCEVLEFDLLGVTDLVVEAVVFVAICEAEGRAEGLPTDVGSCCSGEGGLEDVGLLEAVT
jgi:hypothetical protein